MGGYEYQHFFFRYNNSWKQYYPSTSPNAGEIFKDTPDYDKYENFLVSFFGRANYTLMNRYYLTVTVRDDGSSRFADHWGLFPSFAFAWRVNEEGFLKNVKWLSNLKLRLGYGKTGQQEGISNYIWFKQYKKGQNFYISRKLADYPVKLSVIARGISVGDELEYTDEVTLGRSILNRTPFGQ